MSETLLKVRDLKKSYGDHAVLKGVSYDIAQGKIVGLLGPNGCGKTSMIKSIVGLINDYEGKILINGKAPGVESKKVIAYLPEKNYLPSWMTPKSAIKYMADFYDNFDMQKALYLQRNQALIYGIHPMSRRRIALLLKYIVVCHVHTYIREHNLVKMKNMAC